MQCVCIRGLERQVLTNTILRYLRSVNLDPVPGQPVLSQTVIVPILLLLLL